MGRTDKRLAQDDSGKRNLTGEINTTEEIKRTVFYETFFRGSLEEKVNKTRRKYLDR